MKAVLVTLLLALGAVTATKDVHKREKRQAGWGQNRGSVPTPTWVPTTIGTQATFGGQNWGNTQPTPVRFPSMFNNMARSRNNMQAPPTSSKSPTSSRNQSTGQPNRPKSVGSSRSPPLPGRGSSGGGRGPPTRPPPTQPIPTYPPTMPPRPVRKPKSRRNRPRPQSRSRAPKSNFGMANIIPPSFLQGLGRAMADKLRTMWINPLYQQQAKAAGDNFVVNPSPVNLGYHACPPGIMKDACVYNPCPRCRNPLIECWTNPCGGCTGEMYLRNRRIHDCETL